MSGPTKPSRDAELIASALRDIGTGSIAGPGGLEFLGMCLGGEGNSEPVGPALAEAGQRIASGLEGIAAAIEGLAAVIDRKDFAPDVE